MPEINEIMTITEVAKYLKVSKSQVNNFMRREFNPLPTIYLTPASPRIIKSQLDEWVIETNRREAEDLQLEHLREDAEQAEKSNAETRS